MRMFVGIPLTGEVAARLVRALDRLPLSAEDLRRLHPEGWHMTLQFLGNTTTAQMNCLLPRLAEISTSPIKVRIVEIGFLGHAILTGLVQDTPQLAQIAEQVMVASGTCGFPREDRRWRPHITLARKKGHTAQARSPHNRDLSKIRNKIDCEFFAREFVLYESFPEAQGSRYEARARFPLREPKAIKKA